VVEFYRSFGSTSVALRERSGRVPLGGTVLAWESDYQQLVQLLGTVAKGYAAQYPKLTAFRLDLEYKKIAPGKLVVKQVRRLPDVDATPVTGFLMPGGIVVSVEEGEHSDVFAKHRLKSEFLLGADAVRLTDGNLERTLYSGPHSGWKGSRWCSRTGSRRGRGSRTSGRPGRPRRGIDGSWGRGCRGGI
jgi:hypothetical protein